MPNDYISYYFNIFPTILSSSEILEKTSFYKEELNRLCLEYALDLKDIMKNKLPKLFDQFISLDLWKNLLGFYWDNEIRRVIKYNESYAVSVKKLKKIKSVIFDIFYKKIKIGKKENEFDIICYNCGELLKYQIKDPNNLPVRARKKCPFCNKMITLRILKNKDEYVIKPYLEINSKPENSTFSKTEIFTEIDNFFLDYIKFSNYVTGLQGHRVEFSKICFKVDSQCLEIRSWLVENLRHVFPTYYGLPLSNTILSYFLFGKSRDRNILTDSFLYDDKVSFRPAISTLLKIEYRLSRLSNIDFQKFNLDINNDELIKLKKFISYIFFIFIFKSPYEVSYISDTTSGGIPVGNDYFIPDYFIIKTIYFVMCDASNYKLLSFNDIRNKLKIKTHFERYLQKGTKFSNIFLNLIPIIENFINLQSKTNFDYYYNNFNLYNAVDELRKKDYNSIVEFASFFQTKVYDFIRNFFGVQFDSEKHITILLGTNLVNINGIELTLHHNLAFDGYLELTDPLKDKFGIDAKWKGIVFEAHGNWHVDLQTYLGMFPYKTKENFYRRLEIDQLKRDICHKFNFIFIEIYENVDELQWNEELIKQIEKQIKTQTQY